MDPKQHFNKIMKQRCFMNYCRIRIHTMNGEAQCKASCAP